MLPFKWEETVDPQDSLFTWRKKAWDRFVWPEPKDEAFQYVPLSKIAFLPPAEKSAFAGSLPEGQRIVFRDPWPQSWDQRNRFWFVVTKRK